MILRTTFALSTTTSYTIAPSDPRNGCPVSNSISHELCIQFYRLTSRRESINLIFYEIGGDTPGFPTSIALERNHKPDIVHLSSLRSLTERESRPRTARSMFTTRDVIVQYTSPGFTPNNKTLQILHLRLSTCATALPG